MDKVEPEVEVVMDDVHTTKQAIRICERMIQDVAETIRSSRRAIERARVTMARVDAALDRSRLM